MTTPIRPSLSSLLGSQAGAAIRPSVQPSPELNTSPTKTPDVKTQFFRSLMGQDNIPAPTYRASDIIAAQTSPKFTPQSPTTKTDILPNAAPNTDTAFLRPGSYINIKV